MAAFELIVVGGGVAGSAAALRAAQYRVRTAWIRGDKDTARRSRGQWVANIDNMLGVHEGIVRGKVLRVLKGERFADARQALQEAGHLHIGTRDLIENAVARIQDEGPGVVDLVESAASAVEAFGGGFRVQTPAGGFDAPALILATGVMDRQPAIKRARGEEILDDPKWIYPFANRETVLYCIRCEGHLTAERRAAVIGAGEAAAQVALMLRERYGSGCCVLTNGEEPSWSERSGRLLAAEGVSVHRSRIVEVRGSKGELHALALEDGSESQVEFALVAMGLHRVYNDLARQLGAELADPDQPVELRHVRIDARGETTVPGLFAVGDMAKRLDEPVMKQIYTAQEYAVRAVDVVDSRRRHARRRKLLGEAG